MNVEDLKKSLRELQGKNKDNLRKRKGLIKEMKNLPYSRANFKKVKGLDGQPTQQVTTRPLYTSLYNFLEPLTIQFQYNLIGLGCPEADPIEPRRQVVIKEERNQKQKEIDAVAPQEFKQRDRRMFGSVLGHLQRAKKILDSQEATLQKMADITKRVDEKDKKEAQDLKENQDKRKETLFHERKELEKELALDEFKRQQLTLQLQFALMQEYFITKSEPEILWKPFKMNEGLSTLKKESTAKLKEMEQNLRDKLSNAYKQFSERDQAKAQQKEKEKEENPEQNHETSQSESDESEVSVQAPPEVQVENTQLAEPDNKVAQE